MKGVGFPIFIILYYLGKYLYVNLFAPSSAIHFLNVGQGDSTAITVPEYGQILIDTGPDYQSNYLSARDYIFPLCRIKDIFITHYDSDHSGGLERIIRFCSHAVVHHEVHDGQVWKVGNVSIDVIKGEAREDTGNEQCNVLLIKTPGYATLITGDATLESLQEVAADFKGPLEVYKVPHHGSQYNNSLELLRVLQPKKCVISVGRNNYGHPANQVLEDINRVGCQLYRTDKDGTIMLYF